MPNIDNKLQQIFDSLDEKIEVFYTNKNQEGIIAIELQKWELLPLVKEKWDESYHIAKSLIDEYIILNNKIEAYKWCDIIQKCDLERADSGERELIKGKTFFEFEDYNEALQYFDIAFKKSKGREFQGEDPKYLDFYKNPEKHIKS